MNSYELSRKWFDFCFENPEKVKPIHSAIYFIAIEYCNRLGWKEKFGFPSQVVMESIGVKNWRTYSKALKEIVEFGFIEIIEVSKNQYSSNIIAIVKNTKAHTKALDKAMSKHGTKHCQSTYQSTVSINKLLNNKTIKLLNKNYQKVNENLERWLSDDDETKNIKTEFSEVLNYFIQKCPILPTPRVLTQKRKSSIKKIIKDFSLDDVYKAIDLVSESDFLNGKNKNDWKADFDWIFKPNNFIKILEGNYNKKKTLSNERVGKEGLDMDAIMNGTSKMDEYGRYN